MRMLLIFKLMSTIAGHFCALKWMILNMYSY